MSIINFGDQFANEYAYWYPVNKKLTPCFRLAVQNMNEARSSYTKIGENLVDAQSTLTLRTRYKFDYRVPSQDINQHIKYREKWYEITDVRPVELGTLGLYRNKEYYLTLIEVSYEPD